jgi:hypothetical protein
MPKILENYRANPLKRWTYNWDEAELKLILILEKQIQDGASLPTYLCKSENGRLFVTGLDDFSAGFSTKEEAWEAFGAECDLTIVGLEKQRLKIADSIELIVKTKQKINKALDTYCLTRES